MDIDKKQRISFEIIKVLKSRLDSFPCEGALTRNSPFHKAFLNAFSEKLSAVSTNADAIINMSSWMQGLNTTLGQNFFENVAQILCDGEKRTFKDNRVYTMQAYRINELMTDLKNATKRPNVFDEEKMLNESAHGETQGAPDFTADCFFEDDKRVVAIELKSVRPNSGEMRGEKQKVLFSRAALKTRFPGKEVKYYFGFPFDPLSETETGYNKDKFMNNIIEFTKFCAPDEVLVAEELWSFLSEEAGAMGNILSQIRAVATPDFSKLFDFICNPKNLSGLTNEYECIAERWELYNEVVIAKHIARLKKLSTDSIQKAVNKCAFNSKGEYNENRARILLREICRDNTSR